MDLLKSLNIDPWILLCNGVLFLLLVQIMDRVFWRKIIQHLEQRRETITGAYRRVEETRREMEQLREEYQNRLARIEAEARTRIQRTVRDAQRQREEMIAQARREAEEIMQQGMEHIAREQEAAHAAMQRRLSEITLETIGKALGTTPAPAQAQLVEEFLARKS